MLRAGIPVAFLAIALSGCGSRNETESRNSEPAPAQAVACRNQLSPRPVTQEPADARPIVAAFGDSISAGFGVEPGKSFPDDLQRLIDKAGYRYRVVNLGVSGDTTTDGLERLPTVLAIRPAIVILEFGGNDGLRGLPVTAAEGKSGRDYPGAARGACAGAAGGNDTAAELRAGIYSIFRQDLYGTIG